MKAVFRNIWILVMGIIVIVAGFVLVSMQGSVENVKDLAKANSLCSQWCSVYCSSTGRPPANWNAKTVKVGDDVISCSDPDVFGNCTC